MWSRDAESTRSERQVMYAVAFKVGENPMSAETWSADSIVIVLLVS